jgi:hypothetical protein
LVANSEYRREWYWRGVVQSELDKKRNDTRTLQYIDA